MPATAVQVFGPITVDPGFNIIGEKTLLTMNTTLPAGLRNIILVSYAGYTDTVAQGTFRIYKGSTLLYETRIANEVFTSTRTRPFHHLLVAVDSNPAGNDSYSFRINVAAVGVTTGNVHVQGMVIKADTAVWGYNTTAVNIPAGGTGTVVSITTNFPPGSKVVVIATVYAAAATTTAGNYLVGAGNIKLKSGATVVSSNQFNIGSYSNQYPLRVSLIYLDTPSSSSQTYSVEITNGSTVAQNCYAEIVAFDVTDAAFLDTASIAVGTAQTTVGNLTTNLSGDVAVIALAAAERTAGNDGDTFLENTVVLQRNNLTTGQVGNLVRWYIFRTSHNARSGVLPLFRYDTGVTNPSYQVKMTANSGTPNGEAKILAFSVVVPVLVAVTDIGTGTEAVSISITAADSAAGFDVVDMVKEAPDTGAGTDTVLLNMPVGDAGAGFDVIDVDVYGFTDDAGAGADDVSLSVSVIGDDIGLGSEAVGVSSTVPVDDAGTGSEFALATGGFVLLVDDAGTGLEIIDIAGSVSATDAGSAVEAVDAVATVLSEDSGAGAELIVTEIHQPVSDSGAGVDEVMPSKEMSDIGAATELVDMAKEALDAGAAIELIGMAKEAPDSGTGFDAVYTVKEALDAGAGVDEVLPSRGAIDEGTAIELVNMSKESLDAGAGLETVNSPVFYHLSDSGAGVELLVIAAPQSDAGAGTDVVDITRGVSDTGAGVDVTDLLVGREVFDTGTAVELLTAITSIPVFDSGTGLDVVGIIATIPTLDAGAGIEEATRTLSMFGDVTIDEIEIIGLHSIPYSDLVRDSLPVQVQRNAAADFVYIDSDQVGDVLVEWEDRVADVYRGRRTITVMGLVRIVD